MMRSLGGVMAVVVACVVLAAPATVNADPNPYPYFQSQLSDSGELPGGAGSVRVVNDDAIAVVLAPGNTFSVPGYGGEPYLQADASGRVEVNRNSPSYYVNRDRLGLSEVPARLLESGAVDSLPPDWEQVPLEVPGVFEFHDHRVHWMGLGIPPQVDPDGRAFDWVIPVVVNDQPVELTGSLFVDVALAASLGVTALGQTTTTPQSQSSFPVGLIVVATASMAVAIATALGRGYLRRKQTTQHDVMSDSG